MGRAALVPLANYTYTLHTPDDVFLTPGTVQELPSGHFCDLSFVSVPLDSGVAEHVEKLAPKLQVSRCVRERLPPDLTDDLRSWWGKGSPPWERRV